MKKLLLLLLISVNCHAGSVKLTWTMPSTDTNSNPIVISKFRVYWATQGNALNNIIDIGPPAPAPWKTDVYGVGTYSKTLTKDAWIPGASVCFAMSAFSGTLESGVSNVICRNMNTNPAIPTIINVDEVP